LNALSSADNPGNLTSSHLKKRILVSDRSRGEIKTGGILKYSEDLNFASNKDMGPKGLFEMACFLSLRNNG
jgi:hypothetical protein